MSKGKIRGWPSGQPLQSKGNAEWKYGDDLISIIHFLVQACQNDSMSHSLSDRSSDFYFDTQQAVHLEELIIHFVRMFIGKGGFHFLEGYSIFISKSFSLSIQANHYVERHKDDLMFAVPFRDIPYQDAIKELFEEGISANRETEIIRRIVNQVQMHINEQE